MKGWTENSKQGKQERVMSEVEFKLKSKAMDHFRISLKLKKIFLNYSLK